MGQNYTVKKFKADWGFFNLDTSFSHEHVSVPPGAHRWNDTVGRSLTGCLDTVARRFNSFSDGAWRSIERSQDIGVEEMDPYESCSQQIAQLRIDVD